MKYCVDCRFFMLGEMCGAPQVAEVNRPVKGYPTPNAQMPASDVRLHAQLCSADGWWHVAKETPPSEPPSA
jgi:hypothetical protein